MGVCLFPYACNLRRDAGGEALAPGAVRLVHEALVGVVARETAQAGARGGVDEGEREEVALRVAAAEARRDVAHGE